MFAGSSVTREGIRGPWPIPCICTTAVSSSDFPQKPQHRKLEAWQQQSTETPQGYFLIIKHWLFTELSISDSSVQHPAGMTELSCKDSLSLVAEVYHSNTWGCCECVRGRNLSSHDPVSPAEGLALCPEDPQNSRVLAGGTILGLSSSGIYDSHP